jgi:predicted transcriptional regulator
MRMLQKAKRRGRPPKPAQEGERVSLGLKVTADIKTLLDRLAGESGRSQSQVAEHLIEKALAYERLIRAMSKAADTLDISAAEFLADVASGRHPGRRKPT